MRWLLGILVALNSVLFIILVLYQAPKDLEQPGTVAVIESVSTLSERNNMEAQLVPAAPPAFDTIRSPQERPRAAPKQTLEPTEHNLALQQPRLPKPVAAVDSPPRTTTACTLLKKLTPAQANSTKQWLAKHIPDASSSVKRTNTPAFWVRTVPASYQVSKALLKKQLRNIQDIAILKLNADQYTVSLGIFRERALAQKRLREIQRQVTSIKVQQVNTKLKVNEMRLILPKTAQKVLKKYHQDHLWGVGFHSC